MSKNTTCPICQGTGAIELPYRHGDDERRAKQIMAQALHAHGYSLRQIQKLCGWKSVRSAALAVEAEPSESSLETALKKVNPQGLPTPKRTI